MGQCYRPHTQKKFSELLKFWGHYAALLSKTVHTLSVGNPSVHDNILCDDELHIFFSRRRGKAGPHKEMFSRLVGRIMSFTLEHSQRARGSGAQLEEGLSRAKEKNDEMARMGLFWMGVGEFDERSE